MRLEGPYEGGSPKIDNFADWGWGELTIRLDEALQREVAVQIAETIWDEITREIDSRPGERPGPYISTLGEDEPHLTVHILDTHCIVIPLTEIEFDDELMVLLKKHGERDIDYEATFAMLERMKAVFQGWIDKTDALATELKEESSRLNAKT
jgi:hypothetical protein